MITKIDRYILFLYFRVFVICFSTLVGLLVVVQLFTNIDEFVAFGKQNAGFGRGLIIYFGPQMLSIFDRMCGLITLLAIMFVVAWMHRTNELTAIMAAGISKRRIVLPLLFASCGLIFIAAVLRETAIPRYSAILSKSPRDLQGDSQESLRPTEDFDKGMVIVGRQLLKAKRVLVGPVFKFTGPVASLTRQIQGSQAEFLDANDQHPVGYLVSEYRSSEPLTNAQSVFVGTEPFLLLNSDNPWLAANQCFIPCSIEFDMLSGGRSRQYASTSELIWRVKHQSHYHGPDFKVAIHSRFAQPLLDLTQILIGLPLILNSLNRNVVRMMTSCVISFAVFYAVSIGLRTLGSHETLLTASAGAWAPLLIFAPWAWARSVSAMDS